MNDFYPQYLSTKPQYLKSSINIVLIKGKQDGYNENTYNTPNQVLLHKAYAVGYRKGQEQLKKEKLQRLVLKGTS